MNNKYLKQTSIVVLCMAIVLAIVTVSINKEHNLKSVSNTTASRETTSRFKSTTKKATSKETVNETTVGEKATQQITTPTTNTTKQPPKLSFTESEKDMLLRIGMCEAGVNDVECIALTMLTVINRVNSSEFPGSISNVIHQLGQYTPVQDGSFARAKPNAKCYQALDLIMNGWDKSNGALYFESLGTGSWHSRNLTYLFQHCNLRFYK